jgi:tRNA-splicing ligase RtcB
MKDIRFRKIADYTYEIDRDQEEGMRVPGILFSDQEMLDHIVADQSVQQVINVSKLPGIVRASYAMPDVHSGYGFPIGGVAAFSYEDGIISPGGVGYDINCGVSFLITDLSYDDIRSKKRDLVDEIYRAVPSGLGNRGQLSLTNSQMNDVMAEGINWAIDQGMGFSSDRDHTEEGGRVTPADPSNVSNSAKQRGKNQLGTLGAGNHFLEIQRIDRIIDTENAKKFGINRSDQIGIMIHTGSRGLGHQVASDYIDLINRRYGLEEEGIPDRQLVYARTGTALFDQYFTAMNAAANFGFCNREIISARIRKAFSKVIGMGEDEIRLVYSLAHNIAKVEEHTVEGKRMKIIVHRKGATRAFPPGRSENGQIFAETGHPVLIPGDMGTASYIMVGMEGNMDKSFSSSCHGAGRMMSRKKSSDTFKASTVEQKLENSDIYLRTASRKAVVEEAPGSYKNVDSVVSITAGAGLASAVVRMIPTGVVKG